MLTKLTSRPPFPDQSLTVHHDRRRGAASLGHDVAGDARVVPRIGEARLGDDEAVVASRVCDGVRAQRFFVFEPLHLRTAEEESVMKEISTRLIVNVWNQKRIPETSQEKWTFSLISQKILDTFVKKYQFKTP